MAALTPDSDWVTGPFDMLDYKTGESLTGKEFRLDWTKNGDDQYSQVKFIEIDYITGKRLLSSDKTSEKIIFKGKRALKYEPIFYYTYISFL